MVHLNQMYISKMLLSAKATFTSLQLHSQGRGSLQGGLSHINREGQDTFLKAKHSSSKTIPPKALQEPPYTPQLSSSHLGEPDSSEIPAQAGDAYLSVYVLEA